ncbi:competence protein CoiA family protein [Micromonospora chalcea]|uniref:competence protein CoiA family protein n=1 Tax=Micromonospora chalcea TaxID=1874 RepID=UPI003D753A7D
MGNAYAAGGRGWESIDPVRHHDGVYYLPAGLELQPREAHWGHPGERGLRQRVIDDRPQGIRGRKLLCLLCMRINAEAGRAPRPIWMTFVQSPYGPLFRHEGGRAPHAEHEPESDIHKALKERKARTWEAAGATEVSVESWRPRAGRRPDVLAVGRRITVAGEVQHSPASPRAIQSRQKSLVKAGDRVVWTTDRDADSVGFLHLVPHLVVPALGDHRSYLDRDRLELNAGAMAFERQRCGWTDIWNGGSTRCPVTHKAAPCGGWHLYPTLAVRELNRMASAANAMFPCGPRVHLDYLLEGILNEQWLPYRWRNRVTWIPADAHDEVVRERGGAGVERAENPAPRPRDRAAERACEKRLGLDRAFCCGGRTGRPDAPLLTECLMCPKSPTYWRNAAR